MKCFEGSILGLVFLMFRWWIDGWDFISVTRCCNKRDPFFGTMFPNNMNSNNKFFLNNSNNSCCLNINSKFSWTTAVAWTTTASFSWTTATTAVAWTAVSLRTGICVNNSVSKSGAAIFWLVIWGCCSCGQLFNMLFFHPKDTSLKTAYWKDLNNPIWLHWIWISDPCCWKQPVSAQQPFKSHVTWISQSECFISV